MKNLKSRLSLVLVFVLALALSLGFSATVSADAVSDARANVLTYEGMLARTTGDSGIRSLFSIDKQALATLEGSGYTVEIGASMAAAKVGDQVKYSVSDLSVVADSEKGYVSTKANVATVVVYSSKNDATYATNKYVSETASTYKFAFTTLFSETYETSEYYTAEFCYRGFIALTKDGETEIVYADAKGSTFGDSISLYEIVSYFVSGEYTGEKAEEYANLGKFQDIVEVVTGVRPGEPVPPSGGGAGGGTIDPLPPSGGGTDEPEGKTEWEFLLDKTFNKGEYIDRTVTVSESGFYNINYIATNTANVQMKHQLVVNEVAQTEFVSAYFLSSVGAYGTYSEDGNSVYAVGAALYLPAGTHTIRFTTALNDGLTVTALQIKLAEAVDINESNSVTKQSSQGNNSKYSVSADFTFENLPGAGKYRLYILGATIARTGYALTFSVGDESVSFIPKAATNNVATTNLYTVGEFTLAEGTNVLHMTSYSTSFYLSYTRMYFVKVGDAPETPDEPDTPVTPDPVTLDAPVVTLDGAVASWEAIPNASGYKYTLNGGAEQTASGLSVTLSDGDTLVVKAVGNGTEYLDSAWSNAVTYTAPVVPDEPDEPDEPEIPEVKTEWEFLMANIMPESAHMSDGYYKIPIRKYTDITVNVSVAGNYNINYICSIGEHYYPGKVNVLVTYSLVGNDGQTTNSVAVWIKGKGNHGTYVVNGQSEYVFGTALPLDVGTNTIRIYAGHEGLAMKAIQVKLDAPETPDEPDTPVTPDPVTLDAPVVTLDGAVASWNAVANASGYAYTINGTEYTTTATSVTLTDGQTITVKAVGNGTEYLDSAWSNAVTYTAPVTPDPVTLDAPVVTIDGAVASWEAIQNASGYVYTLNGGAEQTASELSITLSDGDTLVVKAVGNGTEYLDSAWSNAVTYTAPVVPDEPDEPDEPEIPEVKTEWEFLFKDLAGNAFEESTTNPGYYVYPRNWPVYITVTVGQAGFYSVNYIAVSTANVQVKHQLVVNESVQSEYVSAYFPAGTYGAYGEDGSSEYAFGAALYLTEGTHTIRFTGVSLGLSVKAIQVKLAEAVDMSASDCVIEIADNQGTKYSGPAGKTYEISNAKAGAYKLYILGAYGANKAAVQPFVFTANDVAGKAISFVPPARANNLCQTRLYVVGSFMLNEGSNTLTIAPYNVSYWFGTYRIYLVRVGDAPEPETLATPSVTVDALTGVASWAAIPNASGYAYTINGGDLQTTTDTSLTLSDGDTLSVKALGDGVDYVDSGFSTAVTFVKKTLLATPVVTVSSKTGVASWEAVTGASGYAYKVNGGDVVTTTDTSVTLTKYGDTVTVMAVGGGDYLDGAWSTLAIYEKPITLSSPVVTVSAGGVASWTAITGATAYAYKVNGGAEKTTTATSVQLTTDGDEIVVMAVGDGDRYLDGAWSEAVAFVKTEFPVNVADTVSASTGLTLESDGYYLLTAAKEANYIEFTVDIIVPGLYGISLDAKTGSGDTARIYFKNTTDKGDGWVDHSTTCQISKGTTTALGTVIANQYLYQGTNTVRIYLETGDAPVSFKSIRLSLVWKDIADTKLIVSEDNVSNVVGGIDGTGYNGLAALPSGIMALRGYDTNPASATFALPRVARSGMYDVYVVGAMYMEPTSNKVTFACSNGTTFSLQPERAGHYAEAHLYKLGTLSLLPDTDYTMTVTSPNMWTNIHAFYLVRTGDIPTSVSASVTVDPENSKIDAGVLFSGDTNYLTVGLYGVGDTLIRPVFYQKTAFVENLMVSLSLSEEEIPALRYIAIFPTANAGETVPLDDDIVYIYNVDGGITATDYTANKETGEFSVTFDFVSFAHKYVTLVITDANGNTLAKNYTTLPEYATSGVTLNVSVDPAVAASVAAMSLIVAETEGGTTAAEGTTGFTYRFVGDLRLLFVSDLHYNQHGSSGRNNNLHGMDADARAQHLVDSILREAKYGKIDGVFFLGDLCSAEDHYMYFDPGHKNYGVGNTGMDLDGDGDVDTDDYYRSGVNVILVLQEKYLSKLEKAGVAVYCVPGNHDTIQNHDWNKIFGYKEKFGYTETEYIVKFAEHKTAVIMLNMFDEEKGSMTQYYAGKQTLGYTPANQELLFSFLDELKREGYETVYIAGHLFQPGNDPALTNAAAKYGDIIKAFIYGDVHNDAISWIGGIPSFCDGHYSSTLIEYVGEMGERYFDNQRLPLSFVIVEDRGGAVAIDYYKDEALYFGRDNYTFLAQYLNITPATAADHMIILTTFVTNSYEATDSQGNPITKYEDIITAGYYNYTIRTDLSDADRAIAERIVYQLKTYDMDMYMLNYGDTDTIPNGYVTTGVTYYQDTTASGAKKFVFAAGATGAAKNGQLWCYYYMGAPTYESFFKERMVYKSYEIFGDSVKNTYTNEDETTRSELFDPRV